MLERGKAQGDLGALRAIKHIPLVGNCTQTVLEGCSLISSPPIGEAYFPCPGEWIHLPALGTTGQAGRNNRCQERPYRVLVWFRAWGVEPESLGSDPSPGVY